MEEKKGGVNEWEREYLKVRSNSANGVLVEMDLYGENDRSNWLIGKITKSLEAMDRSTRNNNWVIFSPGVAEQIDEMMRDLESEEGGEA